MYVLQLRNRGPSSVSKTAIKVWWPSMLGRDHLLYLTQVLFYINLGFSVNFRFSVTLGFSVNLEFCQLEILHRAWILSYLKILGRDRIL